MSNKKLYYYIYRTVCSVTNRFYIGMHSTRNLDDGYLGSGIILRRSLYKYGKDNHRLEILEYCESKETLAKREAELVNEDLLRNSLCMNLKLGGHGGWTKEEQSKGGKAGSLVRNQKFKDDPVFAEKIREVARLSLIKYKDRIAIGVIEHPLGFLGKTHNDKTKENMSIKHKENGDQRGSKNSQFGKMWITDGNSNQYIKKDQEIPEGWKRGRITLFHFRPV